MCVVSMVHDHYQPFFPPDFLKPSPSSGTITITGTPPEPPFQIISREEIAALQKLIVDFKTALEAAKTVDKLTNQPDCLDPAKAGLEERVAKLEKQLAQLLAERDNQP